MKRFTAVPLEERPRPDGARTGCGKARQPSLAAAANHRPAAIDQATDYFQGTRESIRQEEAGAMPVRGGFRSPLRIPSPAVPYPYGEFGHAGMAVGGPLHQKPEAFSAVGLGGFVDGIVLHQILQWHHMVSATGEHPTNTVAGLEANTLVDGFCPSPTALRRRPQSPPSALGGRDGSAPNWSFHFGLVIAGWGFHVVEGLIDHHWSSASTMSGTTSAARCSGIWVSWWSVRRWWGRCRRTGVALLPSNGHRPAAAAPPAGTGRPPQAPLAGTAGGARQVRLGLPPASAGGYRGPQFLRQAQ